MITDRCPHDDNTPVGELCERCEREWVGLVELDADGEGVVTFLVPISQGLELEDYKYLLSKEERDEALVRRKLMTDGELDEAMLEPYEEDPKAAEEDTYEDELVVKLDERLTELVGERWGRATLYVVPDPPESSWARTLLSARPEEVRIALEGQIDPQD